MAIERRHRPILKQIAHIEQLLEVEPMLLTHFGVRSAIVEFAEPASERNMTCIV